MKGKELVTRRRFFKNVSFNTAAGVVGTPIFASAYNEKEKSFEIEKRLPREVWLGSVDTNVKFEKTIEERIKNIFKKLENMIPYHPDVICLPETFPHSWVIEADKMTLEEKAEEVPGPVSKRMAEFAKKHRCYIICPIYTKENRNIYNSAVLLDRTGDIAGIYHKAHATEGEIEAGIKSGPLNPPVFKTDFGTIGIQICYDFKWADSWRNLKKKGAEIVFFPSEAAGGQTVSIRAHDNRYIVVSSTGDDARIIDVDGKDIAGTGYHSDWVCAPVNLEKVFVNIAPYSKQLDGLRKKYGRKVYIKLFQKDGLMTIESLHPDVRILDVLKEYNLPTYDEMLENAEEMQRNSRL
ncbi:carbon-nitrogen hydrolase family protein [Candidatus Latescibacterota bacterium]